MPEYLAPGVYVEEVSSGIKPIEGVSTSTAGFLGRTERGPEGAYLVTSFTEYQRLYGGFMSGEMYLPDAVKGFFDNGGKRAFISRASKSDATKAAAAAQEFTFTANGFGRWGNNVYVLISPATRQPQGAGQNYRVTIVYYRKRPAVWVNPLASPQKIAPLRLARPDFMEDFDNLTGPSDVESVVNARSVLVTVKAPPGRAPSLSAVDITDASRRWTRLQGGGDEADPAAGDAAKASLALERATKAVGTVDKMNLFVAALEKETDLAAAKNVAKELSKAAEDAVSAATAITTASADVVTAAAAAKKASEEAAAENIALQGQGDLAKAKASAKTIATKAREVASNATTIIGAAPDILVEAAADAAAKALSAADDADAVAAMSTVPDAIQKSGKTAAEAASAAYNKIKSLPGDFSSVSSPVSDEAANAKSQANKAKTAADEIAPLGSIADVKTKAKEAKDAVTAAVVAAKKAQGNARMAAASAAATRDDAEAEKTKADQPNKMNDFVGLENPDGTKTGLKALDNVDGVSILVAPEHVVIDGLDGELDTSCRRLADRVVLLSVAERQQFLDPDKIRPGTIDSSYAAFYHPWIEVTDPANTGPGLKIKTVPAIGHIAGICARTDITRGVHKAPANEVVIGALDLPVVVGKGQQDILNPRGVNCIRDFRPDGRGLRLWGARTTSSDPEWKYLNVRRLFLFLEESIDQGTQWVVFEPNSDPTWAAVRQNISNFLLSVWRSGALLGTKPEEAFFVRCDRTTMTDDDILNGRLVCMIGVAPVRPAEFVIIRISQMTSEAKV